MINSSSAVMMSLGGYRFIANENPYKESSSRKEYSYSSRDRWRGVESLQFKGRKAEVRTFSISVIVSKKSDLDIIPRLSVLGDKGEPLKMISSHETKGGYLGEWVITSIEISKSEFMASGSAQVQEATLTVKEWVK